MTNTTTPGDPARQPVRIIVFPRDNANPYQRLLYAAMSDQCAEPIQVLNCYRRPGWGPIPFFAKTAWARLRRYDVVHIHWQAFGLLFRGRALRRTALLNALASILWLRLLRGLGLPVVWTVHNITAHDPETANDVLVAKLLARTASGVIVHSTSTVDAMRKLGISVPRVTVIPHGSYARPAAQPERGAARAKLGIPAGLRVVLFLGHVKGYKGVPDLISAWADCPRRHESFLLVAGTCLDGELRAEIDDSISGLPARFDEGFISEEDLPRYFSAADIVCCPFRKIVTSGSALLGLTYGRPIIAPRLGTLRDLPTDVGFLYEPGGLAAAVEAALAASTDELLALGERGQAYADSQSWYASGAATLDLYAALRR